MEMLPTIVPSTEHSVSDNDIPHTSLRTNGKNFGMIGKVPFVVRLSNHE
jgi:hypothetical protein